jgi:hypothetical protein
VIGRIAAPRDNAFKFHAIVGLQKFEAVVEALKVMQPASICSDDGGAQGLGLMGLVSIGG